MKFLKFTFIFLGLFVINSCKNDLDLNAPYKEIPSIYAVLNPQDQQQMIRINKLFLGEGDANVMAQVADSVNYGPGELTVTLTRTFEGKPADASADNPPSKTIVFDEAVINTAPGAFNST